MFSIHIFLMILIVQSMLTFVLNLTCLGNFRCLKGLTGTKVWQNFVQGSLRIFLSGFLEILLCSIIGLDLFQIIEQTSIDEFSALVTIAYLIGLVIFSVLLSWFVFYRMRTLV